MDSLDKKLFRDVWRMRGQCLAVSLVIACGVAVVVMSLSMIKTITGIRTAYYERNHFADVFVQLKRAPLPVAERIAALPGVQEVQPRISTLARLDIPNMLEPVTGKFISLDDHSKLNLFHLRKGRTIRPDSHEVVVSEAFAEAQKLEPGDSITAVINGHRQKLNIAGIALSPEYVFEAGPGEIIPDHRRFGVFWISYKELASAMDMDGAFNDLTLTLTPDAQETEVIRGIDHILDTYGGLGAYNRRHQSSNGRLADELQQLTNMSHVIPTIFLCVSAFLLNIVMSRIIGIQREQIAILKAFGYSSLQVGWHYIKFAFVIVLMGSILGMIGGIWLGRGFSIIYMKFFRFPIFEFQIDRQAAVIAIVVSSIAALAGVLSEVRKAIRIPPAEAMRPEPPENFRPAIVERLGLQAYFSQVLRMAMRHIERKRLHAFMTIMGLALATALMMVGSFLKDSMNWIEEFSFHLSMREDVIISFTDPASYRSLAEVRSLPGVLLAEPRRVVPCRLRHGVYSHLLSITGVPVENQLQPVLDASLHTITIPPRGVVLSAKLAEILGVKIGDTLQVEVLEGERPMREILVAGLVNDFAGTNAWMDIDAVNQMMREGYSFNGVIVREDKLHENELFEKIKKMPRIANVSLKSAILEGFETTTAESLNILRTIYAIFASVIAFGVVYNSARIALAERGRELATLRVIGFTRYETSGVLLSELALLTVMALPLGMVFGNVLAFIITRAVSTETIRLPYVIQIPTYAYAVGGVLVAASFSGFFVARQVSNLDLVGVLKAKD